MKILKAGVKKQKANQVNICSVEKIWCGTCSYELNFVVIYCEL